MNAPLAELFRYNRWATRALLDSCSALRAAELRARPPGISGSVGELLLHIVGAEQTFVSRFPKSFFLLHALEHGVEHRTEVKVALAQLGIETPDLDAWPYAAVAGFGQEVP